MALGQVKVPVQELKKEQFKSINLKRERDMFKNISENKILTIILSAVVVAMLSWGTWVTVCSFKVEGIEACATENEEAIKEKGNSLQQQINTRMNKQDDKLDVMKKDFNKSMDKQDKKIDGLKQDLNQRMNRQETKLDMIIFKLNDMKK